MALSLIRPTHVEESFLHPASFTQNVPRNVSLVCPSILQSSSSAAQPEPVPVKYPPSILRTRAFLPTSSSQLTWPLPHVFWANVSRVNSYFFEYQGMPMWPLDTQITGLANHRSCKPSHLSPQPNFKNPIQSSFSLFSVPLSNPHPCCPSLSSHSRDLFFHCKVKSFHEQGQRSRALFAHCCCHLPAQCQSFCGCYLHCMNSPRPCWHHTPS